ncbi:ABC transporter permease [Streptomyces sp. NPDC004111]|uniref:ABC transporter permease n=1 Tax=Streptomyces sp. NPDC004111 TaxID=3364690 RepID=UPI003693DDFB
MSWRRRGRAPVVVRWARHHALVLCAAALAVLLAATVLAALASLTETAVEGGAQRRLAADPGAVLTVVGDHVPERDGATTRHARTDPAVREAVRRNFGPVPHRTAAALRAPRSFATEFGVVDGSGRERDDLTAAVVSLEGVGTDARRGGGGAAGGGGEAGAQEGGTASGGVAVSGGGGAGGRNSGAAGAGGQGTGTASGGVAARGGGGGAAGVGGGDARLVEGRWPGVAGGPVEAALPVDLAGRLRVRPGGTFGLVVAEGRRVQARMTGTYDNRPGNPALWRGLAGSFGSPDRLVLVPRAAFLAEPRFASNAKDLWLAVPRSEGLRLGGIEPLRERLRTFVGSDTGLSVFLGSRAPDGVALTVEGTLPIALGRLETPILVSRAGLYIPASLLAALAAAALVLTARQLAEHRRPELALLAARGAGTPRIAGSGVTHWAAVALPTGLAAPFLAGPLLSGLGRAGLVPGRLPGSALLPVGWAFALLAVLVHGAAMLTPALRTAADRAAVGKLRRRPGRLSGAQRAGTDLALAAVAVLGWLQLRQYRSPVGDGAGVDPVLVLAPVTMTCAAALLTLRLLPVAARLAEPLARRARGLVPSLGGRQVGRRVSGHAGPLLVVALALAVGALSGTSLAILDRGDHDQAAFATGSDLRIVPDHSDGPPSGERRAKYAALPRASALTPVFETEGGFGQETIAVTSLNTAAGVVPALRPDLARRPIGELLAPLGRDVPGHGAVLDTKALRPYGGRLPMRVRLSADGPGRAVPLGLTVVLQDADGLAHRSTVPLPVNGGRPQTVSLPLPVRPAEGRPLRLVQLAVRMDGESVQRTYRLTVDQVPGLTARPVWLDSERGSKVVAGRAGCPGRPPAAPGPDGPPDPVLCSDTARPGTLLDGALRGPMLPAPYPKRQLTLVPDAERTGALPVLASDAFLKATDSKVGSTVEVSLRGVRTVDVRITARIAAVPGASRDVPRLLADSRALAARLVPNGQLLEREESWWVSVRGGDSAAALDAVRQYRYGEAVDVAHQRRELAADPLREGARGALTLCLVLAPAFAVVAFTLHTALSARARQREFALLRALGLRRGQLAAYLWTEQLCIAAVAAVLGTALGTVLASLIMPLVTVDDAGNPVFPWLLTEIPWGRVAVTVAATTALICAVVTVAARFLARTDLARVLRAGEDR